MDTGHEEERPKAKAKDGAAAAACGFIGYL